jgi:hypothetical protein
MPFTGTTQSARDQVIKSNGWALAWLAAMFGVAIIGCHIESGGKRWAAAAWQFALQVPGSPATWGVVILGAGVAMLYGCFRHNRKAYHYGCCVAFGWFVVLCGASFLAFLTDPVVNPLSPLAWGYIAFMFALRFKLSGKAAYE